jgi:hypothetical protein
VSGNTAREFSTPYGTRGGIGGGVDLSSSVLNNCIVWGNTAVNGINIWGSDSTIRNTCSDPLPAGAGNICADPMFKNSGSNFRLKQGSPCVDAGSTNGYVLATDLDGVARPVDGDNNGSAIADMGCYELNAASLPKTYYVDASRPDDSGAATNWATAKQTIQAAVDLAADEDAVLVTNGVYATGGMVAPVYSAADPANALTNRVCITKAITVRSVNGAEVTIIQGASDNGANGPAAMRCTYLAAGAVMEGFTLTGGHILGDWSRGLFDNFGGGALVFTNAELNRCILNENFALYGGGAFLWGGMLNNCRLSGNSTVYDGGGACLDNGGTLNNCTLAGNTAADGSGVFAPNGTLNNCIVWGNTAVNGSNIEAVSSTIRNTCSSPLPEGEGNICADPMFKNSSSNFRLKQGSPCVDAGSNDYAPATDLDGVARPVDGDNSGVAVADMGCYELNAASLPKTFYVDASRPDDSGVATNWATAKQTIQAAVDLATDGDTVLVTNGVYSTGGMVAPPFHEPYNDGSIVTSELTNRVCITKAITVRSVNGAEVTVIQGAGESGSLATARCAYLFPGAVMEGFTLTGGYTMQYDGGGYSDWMGGGAFLLTNAVLNDCVLIENFAWSDGGGAFCSYGGTLNNCLLIRNTALSGGGAAMGPGGVLNNCLLSDNTSGFEGGGVILWNGGVLNNCTVNGNSADGAGGGVRSHSGTLNNCIVWGNTGASANIYVDGESTIRNTCSDPLPEGDGNIFADPMFDGNHLQASSPCINAGNNSYVSTTNDLAGNPRIVASVVDMGAYEFTGLPGDFDCDGLSDEWETRHFGNINRAVATAICSNGVNTIREAYIAGLDPNDAAAFFEMDGDRTAGKSVLWWNATSGRVYSVYFSTNLMNGFQPLETNIPWTAGAFTDSVHNAYGQGYYKIDVKLDD